MKVRLLQPKDKKQWDELVKRSKKGSFFHTYDWLKFIEEGLGLQPFHIVVEKDSNIVAGMPIFSESVKGLPIKRLVSLPLFGGGLYLNKGLEKESLEKVLTHIKQICNKFNLVSHRFITSCLDYCKYSNYFKYFDYNLKVGGCSFLIDLKKPYSEIEAGFSSAKKRNLKKVRKMSIKVVETEIDEESMKMFYETYLDTMKRVKGNVFPWEFFQKIPSHMKGKTKLFMVKLDERFIGGLLHFIDPFQSRLFYSFGGSYRKYNKYMPQVLLHVYSIKWAKKNGYHYYDMGGSSFFDSGVFRFKEQWGGEVVPILVWERDFFGPKAFVYKLGKKIYGYFKQR